MEKQKKSYGKTALIVLLLIITIASLVLATYAWAKYSSVTEGNATAQVAKWDVDVKIKEGSNTMEEKFEHVLKERLAPGTSGSFEIDINPKETEVDFDYEIIFDDLVVADDESKPVPAHLHFYTKDYGHTENDEIYIINPETGDPIEPSTQTSEAKNYLKGTVTVIDSITGSKKEKPDISNGTVDEDGTIKKIIYWEWPYEDPNKGSREFTDQKEVTTENGISKLKSGNNGVDDYDDQDTADGMNAYKVKVKFRVITTQLNPSES